MEKPALNPIIIAPENSKDEYEIFTIPELDLSELLACTAPCIIKDSTIQPDCSEARSATFHTPSKTYDLVKLDTSNLMLFSKKVNNEYHVFRQERYVIEILPSKASKLQIYSLLRNQALYTDENTEYAEIHISKEQSKGLLFKEMLEICQSSELELTNILEEFNAFEIGNKYYIFDPKDLIYRCKNLLLEMHKEKIDFMNITPEIMSKFCGKLPVNAQNAILNNIANLGKLNIGKVQLLCANLLFAEKNSYLLNEFITALNKLENILIPENLLSEQKKQETQDKSWVAKNLFPFFAEKNLQFLSKTAAITFNKKEPTIEYIDYLYRLSGNVKKRFYQLGEIKKEWTKQEIQFWLSEIMPLDQKLDTFLAKNARLQNFQNPFNKSSITVYIPK